MHVVVGDVTDSKVRERLVNETVEKFGQLDVLVSASASAQLRAV